MQPSPSLPSPSRTPPRRGRSHFGSRLAPSPALPSPGLPGASGNKGGLCRNSRSPRSRRRVPLRLCSPQCAWAWLPGDTRAARARGPLARRAPPPHPCRPPPRTFIAPALRAAGRGPPLPAGEQARVSRVRAAPPSRPPGCDKQSNDTATFRAAPSFLPSPGGPGSKPGCLPRGWGGGGGTGRGAAGLDTPGGLAPGAPRSGKSLGRGRAQPRAPCPHMSHRGGGRPPLSNLEK